MNLSEPLAIKSRADADEVLLQMVRDESKRSKQQSECDLEIAKIRERYKHIDTIVAGLQAGKAALQNWAEESSKEFDDGKRSIELRHGILSFRLSPEYVALVSKKWKWKLVVDKFKAAREKIGDFIRTKEDLDKDALLKAYRDKRISSEQLSKYGVAICQDDNFYVELKSESAAV